MANEVTGATSTTAAVPIVVVNGGNATVIANATSGNQPKLADTSIHTIKKGPKKVTPHTQPQVPAETTRAFGRVGVQESVSPAMQGVLATAACGELARTHGLSTDKIQATPTGLQASTEHTFNLFTKGRLGAKFNTFICGITSKVKYDFGLLRLDPQNMGAQNLVPDPSNLRNPVLNALARDGYGFPIELPFKR